jgi:phage shock protein A
MANVNFFGRLGNLISGFLSIFISDLEKSNPAIAYENSINNMTEKYTRLRAASAAIIRRREDSRARAENIERELETVNAQLDAALEQNREDLGALLIQKKEQLEQGLAACKQELVQAERDAENAKASLLEVKAQIENLKSEKERMLAQFESAQARKQISDQLEGLSVDAEIRALDTVRTHIKNTVAEANLQDELKNNDLDTQLKSLTKSATASASSAKFQALKKSRQAQTTDTKSL